MSGHFALDEPAPPARPPQHVPPPPPGAAPAARGGLVMRLLYLLSALFVLGAVLANFNPRFGFFQRDRGFDAGFWPWDAFAGPGGVYLDWLPPHAFIVAMMLAGFGLLFCVFLAPGRLRAGLALLAFVLVGVATMPSPGGFMMLGGTELALALLLGGCLACRRTGGADGAKRLLLTAWLALLIFVLFPYPMKADPAGPADAKAPYASPATEPVRGLLYALESPAPMIERPGEAPRPMHLGDWARGNVLNISLLLSVLVGLWRGGRGGASHLLALLVLLNLLGPAIEHALRELADFRVAFARSDDQAEQELVVLLRSSAQVLLAGLRLAVLPLALSLADLLGSSQPSAGTVAKGRPHGAA